MEKIIIYQVQEDLFALEEYKGQVQKFHHTNDKVGNMLMAFQFKYYSQHFEKIRMVINVLKELLNMEIAIGIPSSKKRINNIQKVCDKEVRLIPLYDRVNHRVGGALNYQEEKERIKIEGDIKKYKRILLCDDVKTTGRTLRLYENLLREMGVEDIKKFVIGAVRQKGDLWNEKYIIVERDFLDGMSLNFEDIDDEWVIWGYGDRK